MNEIQHSILHTLLEKRVEGYKKLADQEVEFGWVDKAYYQGYINGLTFALKMIDKYLEGSKEE